MQEVGLEREGGAEHPYFQVYYERFLFSFVVKCYAALLRARVIENEALLRSRVIENDIRIRETPDIQE